MTEILAHNPEALAAQLRLLRFRRGLTQEELAESAGIAQTTVSRYETGGVTPGIWALQQMLEALGYRLVLEEICGS